MKGTYFKIDLDRRIGYKLFLKKSTLNHLRAENGIFIWLFCSKQAIRTPILFQYKTLFLS